MEKLRSFVPIMVLRSPPGVRDGRPCCPRRFRAAFHLRPFFNRLARIRPCLARRGPHDRHRPSPTGCVVKLEVPRIGDCENAYGRTLAYVWIDGDGDGSFEHLFRLGYARTTSFAHTTRAASAPSKTRWERPE